MYEKYVLEAYEYADIYSFPVDCVAIVESLGYNLMTYTAASRGNAEKRKQMMKISGDGFISRMDHAMYYNEKVVKTRIRFTLAHEIGHIILITDDEDVADSFASNLLAPRPIIFHKELDTAEKIQRFFGISISAANQCLLPKSYVPNDTAYAMIDRFYPQVRPVPKAEATFWEPTYKQPEVELKHVHPRKYKQMQERVKWLCENYPQYYDNLRNGR